MPSGRLCNRHAEPCRFGWHLLISLIIHDEKEKFSRWVLASFANLAFVNGGDFAYR